uniref:Uncharacterized protein n=1 Tax=Lactuca sativa TaxID=4236 RepID=A0A9R1V1A9_LACSA|nr:hypothetical protein LSAT_V11C700368480 [Lactuca sativa]
MSSSYKLHCSNHQNIVHQSFHILSTASRDHETSDKQSSLEYSIFKNAGFPLLGTRGLSTSMLSSDASEGLFPSELLSRKQILNPEHKLGQVQDLVIPITNFQNEDKGLMALACDVFDLPIRKDIIHHVVRWQLAKRQHVFFNEF